ncbi:uracil phosphoribosyltransferase [Nanchangia anserum]|uniref:Uracil phosphoribosyltransferase n=1 Tax=Nanchangia anserum TaxID=2692125 RepID=A0A8I0GBY6_9ACTO|nr:uracil phosphoribosyltransferase [Nanchangia anserum]MBD3689476.1 uracil phosphoribosyltransferase [Nanchangia anserum]QOX81669.1 uracil phosphoribosyltransferase [Nanchangia anserum]
MRFTVIDHPLVEHKLTVLRDRNTPSQTFRLLVDELVTLLAYEATRHIRVEKQAINTPVSPTIGKKLTAPRPIVIPILRAGLGMLEGMTRLLPTAEVGFLGMKRDDETLAIETYANRLPDDLTDRQVFLVDPMLATGSTLVAAIDYVLERGARDVTCVCLVTAPEGLATVKEKVGERADVQIVTAALDEGLNEHAYIVPGLGDAGDRLYGIVDA